LSGCGQTWLPARTFHQRCGWKAEDYFTDPKVIALCHAIEADDLPEMERLVKDGADVNAQGKGKMTPLLWAFPDNKLPRFKWLLEHGADPNVVIESEFNTRGFMGPGDAVTHMVCKTSFPGYFEAVFAHGGDPNLRNDGPGKFDDVPLTLLISQGGSRRAEKIRLLIDAGADPNILSAGYTPAMHAVGWASQYSLASLLLDEGADHMVYAALTNRRLVHVVLQRGRTLQEMVPQEKADYEELLARLVDRGESLDAAREDIARWESWSRTTGEYQRKMDAEIAERKAREQADAAKRPE
jgi:hypothetical protein